MKNKISIIIGGLVIVAAIGAANIIKPEKEIKLEETANILDSVIIEEVNKEETVAIEEELQDKEVSVPVPIIIEETTEIEENENIQEQKQYYKVVKVIDGDTISVDINGTKKTLRLIGINTPETVDPRKPVECFGKEASNKAKELLSGQLIELESDASQGDKGKYDRLLRYARTKNGLFYNLEIIKQGYAYEYTYDNVYKYQKEFKQAEDYARNNKLGLWADGVCDEDPVIIDEPVINLDCDCSSNKYNCGDFTTHNEAQSIFDCCGGINNDIHKLDKDKDGIACESLPL